MSASERLLRWAMVLTTGLTGCGETPTLPAVGVDSLVVVLVADPKMDSQPVLVARATAGTPLEGLAVEVIDESGTVWRGDAGAAGEIAPCNSRYGAIPSKSAPYCIVLDWSPVPGHVYTFTVLADNAPPASALIEVPDSFAIRNLSADYDASEFRTLSADWTSSSGAYRYYAMLKPQQLPDCWRTLECRDGGWLLVTADTSLSAVLGPGAFHSGVEGPWTFLLAAVPEALHRALNSGSGEELFPIPAADNIQGGFGVVSAWTTVSVELPRTGSTIPASIGMGQLEMSVAGVH